MDTGAGELSRPLVYAGFSELPVLRLTSHMHSGAAMAVHSSSSPNNTCGVLLFPSLVFDSRTATMAIDDEKAPFVQGFV